MDNTPPPPHTAVGQQLLPTRQVPLLRDCSISDGGFDVNKYLQRQTALCQRLLWRTSTALLSIKQTLLVSPFLLVTKRGVQQLRV
jgi:hypothetical protein